jgi:mono/diheme cytochrome c family protein
VTVAPFRKGLAMKPRCFPGAILPLAGFALLSTLTPASADPAKSEPALDFNRHIRPILSENCFACHGPDDKARKAKLRLDTKQGAFALLRRGGRALVPGKPEESEVITRISSDDPGEIMPPPKSGKHLKPEQIALLKRWVQEGAKWAEHWAFVPPQRPLVPEVRGQKSEVRNPIDAFVDAKRRAGGLEGSPEADRVTLIRRVTLDLTGLPPTPDEVDAFLADQSADAYEKVVDRLLQSPRYGEHMGRFWLDAARYGDTHGLHLDNYREIWPYREWVLRAFNGNMPYDRFVIEQLAGDLLPNPTLDQLVATGFNRCNVTTSEGGSIEEEVFVRNVVDRTETMGTVFLGLTVGCARCHDHKYDPIKTKEFYSLFAFFNSLDGSPLDGNAARHEPTIRVATPEYTHRIAELQARIDAVRKKIAAEVAKVQNVEDTPAVPGAPERRDVTWVAGNLPGGAHAVVDGNVNLAWSFVAPPEGQGRPDGQAAKLIATGLKQNVAEGANPGLAVGEGDTLFAHVYLDPQRPPREIMLQWHTAGWLHRAYWGANLIDWGRERSPERLAMGKLPEAGRWVRLEVEASRVGIGQGTVVTGLAFTQFDGTVYWGKSGLVTRTTQGKKRYDTLAEWIKARGADPSLPPAVREVSRIEPGKRTEGQKKLLRDYFVEHGYSRTAATFEPLHRELAAATNELAQFEKMLPATLVFRERSQPRPAYILKRGEYDQRGEQVSRVTPAALPPMPESLPRNRLGFAQWLVSPGHPLTARVVVNRFWQQFFGTGLVKTAEDFGAQGEPPTHPELLDWLAVRFVSSGWDVKGLVRLIVTSATYRQSSKATPDRLAKDPGNRLLSRGPRFRLDAETLRDQALFVSGLLIERLGGPSVKPPQPSGLWEAVGYTGSNTYRFAPDTGRDKVHRRSLYIFWKRTAPPPQMRTFDAPSRESCTVRRERTNTPLQALLLMNEPQYVESARVLAERAMRQGGEPEKKIAYLFRQATCRKPDAKEMATLLAAYQEQLAEYRRDTEAARKLITIGETKPDANLDAAELAAWTMVANALLNLDEVLTKG